jgi:CheY-like chemotaxis protein
MTEPAASSEPPSRGRHRAQLVAEAPQGAHLEVDAPQQALCDPELPNGGPTRASLAPAGHCPRLVIADDDPVVQLMLSASLSHEFDVVGVAADSEQAIEFARTNQPDAALVDVVMPKGGGLRAVLGILEVAPNTAVVMLSGYKTDGIVHELIQAGAIAYRRKGVPPRVLADTLTESIKVHTAERRESAWSILAWYCLGLDRRSRRRGGP